jgi:MFS family permease
VSGGAPAPGGRSWQIAVGLQGAASDAAWQGTRLMLAYQALAQTGSPVFVGVVAAVVALAGLAVSISAGRLLDRFGGSRVASAGIAVSLIGIGAVLIAHNVVGLLIACVCVGAGYLHVVVGQQQVVSRLTARARADSAFGALTSAVSVGQLVGPPVVTMAAIAFSDGGAHPNTWTGLAACGVLFLIALPSFFPLRRAERAVPAPVVHRGAPAASLRSVLSNRGMVKAILVGAAVIVTVDLLSSFIPVWAIANHIPADVVGWLLALRAFFTITSRLGAARLVARFGRKALLIVTLSLAVLALLLLPLASAWLAVPIMVGLGIGLGLPQPLTLVWMSSLAPPHVRGVVFGARMTVNRLAQVTLPLVVATLAGPAGVIPVFWATAGILGSALLLVGVSSAAELDSGWKDDLERDPSPSP